MKNTLSLFKTRRFLPLFITQFFDAFNSNAFKNALLIWVTYDASVRSAHYSSIIVTLAAALFVLPFFLFSATAGQISDKYPKVALTQKIRLIDIFLMFGCGIGFYLENTTFLLLILFLTGTQAAFFGPLKYSLLPENLHEDELIAGNALIEGGTFLAILLGTIFGGLIISIPHGIYYLTLALILLSIVSWFSSCFITKTTGGDIHLNVDYNIFAASWNIINYTRANKTVWLTIITISWFWGLGAIFLTQFSTYTKQVIHGNAHIVTLFLALFSVGISIGSLLCNKILKGKINLRFAPWGCLGMSIFIIDFYFASQHYHVPSFGTGLITLTDFLKNWQSLRIIFDLLGLAICAGIYIVPLYAVMQHRAEKKYIARVIAVNNIMNALYMVLGSIVTLLMFWVGLNVKSVFLAVGIVNILFFFMLRHASQKN